MKNSLFILIASLFVLACAHGFAGTPVNIDNGLSSSLSSPYMNVDFVSESGSPAESATNRETWIAGNIVFGGDEMGYSATISRINVESGPTMVAITSATGGSRNIHLSVDRISSNASSPLTININNGTGSDWNSRNTLVVNHLEKNGSTIINVAQNAAFVLNTADYLGDGGGVGNSFILDLDGGQASLAGGSTLANGSIGGWGELAVGTGLAIGSNLATDTTDADFRVDLGRTLNVTSSLGGPADGQLTFGTVGSGDVSMDINGALNAGAIVINEKVAMTGNVTGSVNTRTLTINDNFAEEANVAVRVSGLTSVDKDATYTVKGINDEFLGGMKVSGILKGDTTDTRITLGTGPGSMGTINLTGGQIASGGGRFSIDYADIRIVTATGGGAGTQTTALDASAGRLNLGTSNVTVNLSRTGSTIFDITDEIDINNYAQLGGTVTLSGAAGTMKVGGTGVIGNASASSAVTMHLDANTTAHFENGLLLNNYGALVADGAGATVLLGDGVTAGDLTLTGNNQLLGIAAPLNIAASGAGGKISVSGLDNVAHGNVNANRSALTVNAGSILSVAGGSLGLGFGVASAAVRGRLELGDSVLGGGHLTSASDVHVYSGGSIVANHDTATIGGGGPGNAFVVDKGGFFAMETADVRTSGFDSTTINGSFTAGWVGVGAGGRPTTLYADAPVTIGKSGSISVTKDLAKYATTGQILIDTTIAGTNTLTNNANSSYKSMYGQLEFDVTNNGQYLEIVGVSNQLTGNRATDIPLALANLRDIWCPGLIRNDFGTLVYDVMEGYVVAADTEAGNKNAALFDAIGNPDAKNVGKSTLDYMTGAHLYGITDVAIETSRAFVSDITGRAKALRCNFVGHDDVASEEALADTAMNSNYRNRIWAEAHGYWQTGDARGCFSGYSYDASGFTLGYDRVLYPNFAFGLAGDYKDKGALAHDSKIESFSAGAYGTYSYAGGAYVTAFGGYTYSDNNINELRNDPASLAGTNSWAASDFLTETWNAGLNAGYDLRCGGLTVTPSVGINYVQARNSDHSEYLGGVATQKISDARNRGVYLPVELGLQYDSFLSNGGRLRFEANGAYAYNLRKNGLNGFVDYIDLDAGAGIASPDNVRHSYRVGGGVRYAYCQYDIGARYDYIGKSGYDAHRFSATVGMSF